jgi:hypothetical protein
MVSTLQMLISPSASLPKRADPLTSERSHWIIWPDNVRRFGKDIAMQMLRLV